MEYDLSDDIISGNEAEEQGGGEDISVTFDETVDTLWNIIKNDSYIHLLHANIRALKSELTEQQLNVNELWQHVNTLTTTTTTPTTTTTMATTTAVYVKSNNNINKKVNQMLNKLKMFRIKNHVLYNLSFPIDDESGYYLYTKNDPINKEINEIMIQLNLIKTAYNLDNKVYEQFFRTQLEFAPWDEFFPPKPEALIEPAKFDTLLVVKTAVTASVITVLIIFIPLFALYFLKLSC